MQDPRLRTFRMLQDAQGALRIATSLGLREDSEDFRFPFVLPGEHPVVRLLVRWTHLQACHGGVHVVMSRLRERFWVLGCRRVVRKIVHECGQCRRHEARSLESYPGPLPRDRVNDASVFEITGVDLAGPLYLKGGTKGWIVLFTCAVFRAVHLELIVSLSTDAFLQALRRFVARRGRPKVIYSDNGTNFIGTDNAFGRLDWERIHDRAAVQQIKWKFNPPTAAWWGGWWERLIGILKRLLRRTLGRTSLGYEELETILCDCEAVINSRPLTYESEDNQDPIALSPAVFLRDLTSAGLPEVDMMDHENLNRRRRYRQRLRDGLRKRFRAEYLAQLRQRRTGQAQETSVTCGQVVLIGSDDTKRLDWPLARIVQVIPGSDGRIRLCKVKTATGQLLRPVQRLYPLEVYDATSRDSTLPATDDGQTTETTVRLATPIDQTVSAQDADQTKEHYTARTGRRIRAPCKLNL